MVEIFCDRCQKNCGAVAYGVRVNVILNPTPHGYFDMGEPKLTCDNTRYSFTLCQKCFREMGFPNPYMVDAKKRLNFRDTNEKKSYFIEDQINDCFAALGRRGKDAHDLDEQELHDAELLIAEYFDWVEHPGYIQNVPRSKKTGELVLPKEK